MNERPPAGTGTAHAPPRNTGYREQYGVIVICPDATEQERVYYELRDAGYKLRVVTT